MFKEGLDSRFRGNDIGEVILALFIKFAIEIDKYGKGEPMAETIEITLEVNEKEWENLKNRSGLTHDYFLLMFFYQVGERILEAIVRQSKIVEVDQENDDNQVEIYFTNLLNQYAMEELIQKVEAGDLDGL